MSKLKNRDFFSFSNCLSIYSFSLLIFSSSICKYHHLRIVVINNINEPRIEFIFHRILLFFVNTFIFFLFWVITYKIFLLYSRIYFNNKFFLSLFLLFFCTILTQLSCLFSLYVCILILLLLLLCIYSKTFYHRRFIYAFSRYSIFVCVFSYTFFSFSLLELKWNHWLVSF